MGGPDGSQEFISPEEVLSPPTSKDALTPHPLKYCLFYNHSLSSKAVVTFSGENAKQDNSDVPQVH